MSDALSLKADTGSVELDVGQLHQGLSDLSAKVQKKAETARMDEASQCNKGGCVVAVGLIICSHFNLAVPKCGAGEAAHGSGQRHHIGGAASSVLYF